MSDHASSSPFGLLALGIMATPAAVITRILILQHFIHEYGKVSNFPATVVAQMHTINIALMAVSLIGVFLLFPLGMYVLITNNMGGGH